MESAWKSFLERGHDQGEFSLLRPDGNARVLEYRAKANVAPGRHISFLRDVTARVHARYDLDRAEAEVLARSHEYDQLTDSLPVVVARFDRALRHLYVNSAIERVTGIPRREFIGKTNVELGMPGDTCAVWNAALHRVFAGETSARITFEFCTPDGDTRWFDSRLVPEVARSGVVDSVLAVVVDVTEQRRTEERLRASNTILARYRFLAEQGRDITLFIHPSTGQIVDANEAALRAYGYSREALLSRTIFDLRSDNRAIVKGQMAQAESGVLFETLHRRSDGSVFPVEVSSFAASVGGEKLLFSIIRDISERQRLHREREETAAILDAVVRDAPIGIAIVDRDLRFLRVNEALAEMNGRAVDEHLGRAIREVVPNVADQVEIPFRKVLEQGEAVVDLEVVGESGPNRVLSVNAAPLRNADGLVSHAIIVLRDITEERRLQDERERNDWFKDTFVGVLGHDLKNPLFTMITGAGLLLRHENLNESQIKVARRIASAGHRMNRLIEQILDLTRARLAGGIPIARGPANLHAIVLSIVEEARGANPGIKVELSLDGREDGSWDNDRLGQVVQNLVGNAITHGGAQRPIWVHVHEENDGACIEVHNWGAIIPATLLPVLFDPFRHGSTPRGATGLGLGLFIVRELVVAHRGTISVTSTLDEGTTFRVWLPFA